MVFANLATLLKKNNELNQQILKELKELNKK
jgi:hypothetical protein